ncbi:MAG: acylphosphatase [Thiobacillaceae bacterium]
MKITRHLVIRGRVQGVWYRESMRQEAERLGVTGWVRNRRDGTVEAMLQGEAAAVQALIDWAWQGPPAAQVSDIAIREGEGEYALFEKRPTE